MNSPSWAPLRVGTAKGSLLLVWSEARAAAGRTEGTKRAEGHGISGTVTHFQMPQTTEDHAPRLQGYSLT